MDTVPARTALPQMISPHGSMRFSIIQFKNMELLFGIGIRVREMASFVIALNMAIFLEKELTRVFEMLWELLNA